MYAKDNTLQKLENENGKTKLQRQSSWTIAIYVVALFCALAWVPKAQAEMRADSAAHFGVSYALTMATYGFYHKAITLTKPDALAMAIFTSAFIGFTKEYLDMVEGGQAGLDGSDLLHDGLGTFGAFATIVVFDF